jgi:aryl-alcohol dehydrogenase-like predicted oxidoreductase
MASRPLGRTGLTVSRIGLGTVKLGRNTQVKYAPFELPSDGEVEELFSAAVEIGVTLVDTSPAYGESEKRIAPYARGLVVCTKAGEQFDGTSHYDFSPAAIRASAEESRRRLGRIDILLIHSDGNDLKNIATALPVLQELKSEGVVRAIGISAKTQEGILEAVNSLDVVMASYSMNDKSRGAALQIAHDAGLGVIVVKALESGHAADPEAAIRFVLGKPYIDSIVIGTLSLEHLESAVRASESA